MKKLGTFHIVFLLFLGNFLAPGGFTDLYAQDAKKNSVRLKADYFKIMGGQIYVNIRDTPKIDN